ncbi:MAG: hypothetical protein IBX66_05290 [Lutibacter sp.]|nr:hypothetical protein [Lutibacter sp.]
MQKIFIFAKMFKRKLSILFLFSACLLFIGQGWFLHTHIEAHQHDGEHHHHHEKDSDESNFPLLFSHFNHTSDTFLHSHIGDVVTVVKKAPNKIVVLNTHLPYSNSIRFHAKKELVRNKEPFIFISPHLGSLQFRGPPTLFS